MHLTFIHIISYHIICLDSVRWLYVVPLGGGVGGFAFPSPKLRGWGPSRTSPHYRFGAGSLGGAGFSGRGDKTRVTRLAGETGTGARRPGQESTLLLSLPSFLFQTIALSLSLSLCGVPAGHQQEGKEGKGNGNGNGNGRGREGTPLPLRVSLSVCLSLSLKRKLSLSLSLWRQNPPTSTISETKSPPIAGVAPL